MQNVKLQTNICRLQNYMLNYKILDKQHKDHRVKKQHTQKAPRLCIYQRPYIEQLCNLQMKGSPVARPPTVDLEQQKVCLIQPGLYIGCSQVSTNTAKSSHKWAVLHARHAPRCPARGRTSSSHQSPVTSHQSQGVLYVHGMASMPHVPCPWVVCGGNNAVWVGHYG